ncbi:unnamed protein product, partial [Timema podura]|nr:unnamed protein product [Timema podura]
MLQIEPCNTHSCHGYSWFTLPWQPCQVFHSATNITTNSTSLPQFPPELAANEMNVRDNSVGTARPSPVQERCKYLTKDSCIVCEYIVCME